MFGLVLDKGVQRLMLRVQCRNSMRLPEEGLNRNISCSPAGESNVGFTRRVRTYIAYT